ncbi:MAG TPA: LytTR family DNA-binding domain-containing protein [Puia sp.]|nr:LytTR family DNA-binding domain-containing protein [Puia sp.]
MIKAIIIEDEESSRKILTGMLAEHFKNIQVIAVCTNNAEAKMAIEALHADLVISDVELGQETVFTMLQQLTSIDFEILFTTGYDKYAIQAIKFAALDYLVKPFTATDLAAAIGQYEQRQQQKQPMKQFEALFHNLKLYQNDLKKIALPSFTGLTVFPVKDIIHCQAEINYTQFFFTSGQKLLAIRTLKEYEELLGDCGFIRVHKSHLINVQHVKSYTRGEGGTVTMSDGTLIDVSRRKKDEFLQRLDQL